jgi:predicted GNAT family acetyltransferase
MAGTTEVVFVDNPARSRYEARVSDAVAGFVLYESRPGKRVLVHTEVDPAFEGHGIGSRLAQGALDDVRAKGLVAVPVCPFIKGWIRHHQAQAGSDAPAPENGD